MNDNENQYLVRSNGRSSPPRLTALRSVSYPFKTKVTGHIRIGGLPPINQAQIVGENKSRLFIKPYIGHQFNIPKKADEVKKHIRKIRPEEMAIVDQINREISDLKEKREQVIRDAWAKAHVVTIKELESLIK